MGRLTGERAEEFGGLLRRLRAGAGLTQEDLAAAAGVSVRTVSDLERGINLTARRDTARLLAAGLGLSGSARTEFEVAARRRAHAGSARHDGEHAAGIEGSCLVLSDGRLPLVRDVEDPLLLGVHRAAPAALRDGDVMSAHALSMPEYVPRDLDDGLRARLTAGGFVLLVGDSTAGKSRAAFEAIRTMVADHVLVCPVGRDCVGPAVAHAARIPRCVLWLDDLENYLGTGGLTIAHLGRLLIGSGHHRVIIATIRSAEHNRLTAGGLPADDATRQVSRGARQVLAQAQEIVVPRMFSAGELARAHARSADAGIAAALRHADSYGIAEYLAAGPELLREWENARNSSRGPNARGAALVVAAIDIRRAGFTSVIPRALLELVHERYLDDPGLARVPRETVEEAWQWATRPRWATTFMLEPVDDNRVEVFDYLVDVVQNRSRHWDDIPDPVIQAAIADAGYADADSIATTAYAQNRYFLAADAWQRACLAKAADPNLGPGHASTLVSRNNKALQLCELGQLTEADAEHRMIAQIRTRMLGAEHPDTLASRNNLGHVLHGLGRLAEALAEHQANLDLRSRVLGPEHPDTLASRANVAFTERDMGNRAESEAEYRAVLEIRARVLGGHHPDTLDSRNRIALFIAESGGLYQAEEHFRANLRDCLRILGPDHSTTLTTRNHLIQVLRGWGRFAEADAEQQALLDISVRVLGPKHPSTMLVRHHTALLARQQGRLAEAERQLHAVAVARQQVLGADHPSTLKSRASLASMWLDLGRPAEAETAHREIIQACLRTLGPRHPSTLASRGNLASVLRAAGRIPEAEAEYTAALTTAEGAFGPRHPATLAARSNTAILRSCLGEHYQAEAEHRAVAEISSQVLGPAHPATLSCRIDVALALWHQRRYAEARAEHCAVLALRSRQLGTEQPAAATTPDTLYQELRSLGRQADAAEDHRLCLDIERVSGREDHSSIGGRNNLASVVRGLSQLSEADAQRRTAARFTGPSR